MKTATEVGGDYYDFSIKDDDSLNIALGDATGHGMKAGTLVTMMKSLFTANSTDKELKEFFTSSNTSLKKSNLERMMIGLAMLNIKGYSAELINAGLPSIYHYKKREDRIEELNIHSLPLGALSGDKYSVTKINLLKDDVILMLTDGFPELQNENEELYGYERVINSFKNVVDKSPNEIIGHLKDEGRKWVKDIEPDDDVTFVVIKVK
jgi:serine phosphatase RsbU (regulator of sigma subunit)